MGKKEYKYNVISKANQCAVHWWITLIAHQNIVVVMVIIIFGFFSYFNGILWQVKSICALHNVMRFRQPQTIF